MCDQCNADPLSYGEVIPGWILMRARRDGIRWRKDDWGLVCSNDPTFTWTSTPTPCPLFCMPDEEDQMAWFDAQPEGSPDVERALAYTPDDFKKAFMMDPGLGYDLVVAAMTCGYDPNDGGDFHAWFFDHIGEHLKTATGTGHAEPRP